MTLFSFHHSLRISAQRTTLACLWVFFALFSPPLYAWQTAKIDGEDYVSLLSIKSFYHFSTLQRNGNQITLENQKVSVKMTVGGNECFMNGVKFVFSHPVSQVSEQCYISRIDLAKLIDPVLRPSYIPNAGDFRTVILDPGHGGKDAGAINSLGQESQYNLKLAFKAKSILEQKGYRVILTRQSDCFLSLQERVILANAIREEAVFISIHFNSGGSNARGIETFTLSPPGVSHYGREKNSSDNESRAGNQHDSANIALATSLHGSLLRRIGLQTCDRGIKRARFSVLSGVRHPAILMEGGFMSHSQDARLIASEAYQNALATSIADAVNIYRRAVTMPTPAATRT